LSALRLLFYSWKTHGLYDSVSVLSVSVATRLANRLLIGFFVMAVVACGGGERIPPTSPTPGASPNTTSISVTAVLDGDTMCVRNAPAVSGAVTAESCPSGSVQVRVIGVDTPELAPTGVDPMKDLDVWCVTDEDGRGMGQEAKAFVEAWLGRPSDIKPADIQLEIPGAPDIDENRRLLAYVYFRGESLTTVLLKNGLGNVFLRKYRDATIFTNIRSDYAREFVTLEIDAKDRQAGFWGAYRPSGLVPWRGLFGGWPSRCVPDTINVPKKIRDSSPHYPPEAIARGIQGVVVFRAVIAPTGDMVALDIVRSIPELNEAALVAVRQWQYEPARLRGVPVPFAMTLTVNFTLQLSLNV
jgi:TonB family protein